MRPLALLALSALVAHAGIPPVSTWTELRRSPELRTASGARVRVGLSSYVGGVGQPIQVYALADESPARDSEDALGPLTLRVRPRGQRSHLLELREQLQRLKQLRDERLYLATLPVSAPGTYVVELVDPKRQPERVIATTLVEVIDKGDPLWLPLHLDPTAAGDDVSPGRQPASPRGPPSGIPAADRGPLPSLLPAAPSPELTLEVRDGALRLTTDRELDDRLLARWWIDGEPLTAVPPTGLRARDVARQLREQTSGRRTCVLRPRQLELLGVRPDQRVEVQLLLCPDRCRIHDVGDRVRIARVLERVLERLLRAGPPLMPLMTRRVVLRRP